MVGSGEEKKKTKKEKKGHSSVRTCMLGWYGMEVWGYGDMEVWSYRDMLACINSVTCLFWLMSCT